MMATSCLLFPSPYSFVFHFCFPNATSFQALYFFHVSGIIFFHSAADPLPHVAFEGDRALSVGALAATCCREQQLCCSAGAVPEQSCPWCEMLPLLTHVCADRHCFQSRTQAKRCTHCPSVPETPCVSSIFSTGRVWCHDDLISGQKNFLVYRGEGLRDRKSVV